LPPAVVGKTPCGLVHKVFTPPLIENLRQRIQDLTDELLNRVQNQGRMDLIHDYALQIPTTIIAEMLGVPSKDRLKFHRWSSAGVSSSASRFGMLRAIPYIMAFVRYIRSLVKARRVKPEDDLISALAGAEEAGKQLSEDELLAMVVLLLVAGHETTVNLIGNGALALLEHPNQLSRLYHDPTLIKSGIEEFAAPQWPARNGDRTVPSGGHLRSGDKDSAW
jgi:cytochrome P450